MDTRLTNRSNGQLVYRFDEGTKKVQVMIFRKLDAEKSGWLCTELSSSTQVFCLPEEYAVLPITEKTKSWEISMYAAYLLSGLGNKTDKIDRPEWSDPLAQALLVWKGDKRGENIRMFLYEEQQIMKKVANIAPGLIAYKNIDKQTARDRICDLFSDDNPMNLLLSKMTDEGDFFAATCMFSRFKGDLLRTIRMPKGYNGLNAILDTWSAGLVTAYTNARGNGNPYEVSYTSLFPDGTGAWNRTCPLTLTELQELCTDSFNGFLRTQELSSFCDFREWGSGMLDVLTMIPGTSPEAIAVGQEFEAALKRYKDNKNQFGR